MPEVPKTPWQELEPHVPLGDIPQNWNWRAALPCWIFNALTVRSLRYRHSFEDDWDLEDGVPPFVMVEVKGSLTSLRLASEFDDVATGLFYYRDWTRSSLPFVRDDDETYWCGFWFQRRLDAEWFHRQHGGAASWTLDYAQKRDAMRRARDNEPRLWEPDAEP